MSITRTLDLSHLNDYSRIRNLAPRHFKNGFVVIFKAKKMESLVLASYIKGFAVFFVSSVNKRCVGVLLVNSQQIIQ